mmetsp:Transcript_4696/g.13031  ORF Transcript_4696/g.13031 Transcript_4696/m.13031 type:complete len:133 (+) Transcript_4696:364-762(+)
MVNKKLPEGLQTDSMREDKTGPTKPKSSTSASKTHVTHTLQIAQSEGEEALLLAMAKKFGGGTGNSELEANKLRADVERIRSETKRNNHLTEIDDIKQLTSMSKDMDLPEVVREEAAARLVEYVKRRRVLDD